MNDLGAPRLRVRGLSVEFGSGRGRMTALRDVDLDVPAGVTVGLVGESGSGKSTLARAVLGLVRTSAGQVFLDEQDVTGVPRAVRRIVRRQVQLVFQDPFASLNPRLRVGEAIAEAATAHRRLSGGDVRKEVRRLLGLVALEADAAELFPHQFSGGQRQRIAIARALAVQPKLIIADEVTSALDNSVQAEILNLLRDLQAELGLSLLFISHDLAVVDYVSELVYVMYFGRVVEHGPTTEVLRAPRHPYSRLLLDSSPGLGRARPERLVSGEVPDPFAPPSGCAFHPRCAQGPTIHGDDRSACAQQCPTLDRAGTGAVACHFPLAITHQESSP